MTSSALQPLPDRYFIFNFFEQPTDVESFKKTWKNASEYLKDDRYFVATYLHSTANNEAKFKWVNFAVLSSVDICCFNKPDPKWIEITKNSMSKIAKAYPAGYREIASYKNNELIANNKQSPETSGFFITAVQVKDTVTDEEFEANWREWSGADLLHEKLKDNESIEDSFLYRKFTTIMCPLYRYTVRTEVGNIPEAAAFKIANELNQRKFPSGIETFSSFYKVAIKY